MVLRFIRFAYIYTNQGTVQNRIVTEVIVLIRLAASGSVQKQKRLNKLRCQSWENKRKLDGFTKDGNFTTE
jgi:hypothetical protein